jgi:hypothetical protein
VEKSASATAADAESTDTKCVFTDQHINIETQSIHYTVCKYLYVEEVESTMCPYAAAAAQSELTASPC